MTPEEAKHLLVLAHGAGAGMNHPFMEMLSVKLVEKIFTIPVSFFQNNPPEVYHIRLESHPYYFNENGEKIILLPADELKLPARYANPWGIRKRKVLVYKTGEDIVWGMTANLVHEFVNKLNPL